MAHVGPLHLIQEGRLDGETGTEGNLAGDAGVIQADGIGGRHLHGRGSQTRDKAELGVRGGRQDQGGGHGGHQGKDAFHRLTGWR